MKTISIFTEKLKDVILAVVPIVVIVLIFNFIFSSLSAQLLISFIIGAALIIIGLAIFLLGVDIGITPIGRHMGAGIAKSRKTWVVLVMGLGLGFFICIAEPDLHILAQQVSAVTQSIVSKPAIVVVVSVGVAAAISLGLLRIVYNIPLYAVMFAIYSVIFVLALFVTREFLAIAFDSSGATTGALTVPFILALATGVAALKKNSKASEKDSFGLVGIASGGAIISVMIMSIISRTGELTGSLANDMHETTSVIQSFAHELPIAAKDSLYAIIPLVAIFFAFQKRFFSISKAEYRRILKGLLYTFLGLVIFLTGVNAGFIEAGIVVGSSISSASGKAFIIIAGFAIGFVTILAEPAVYVLTHQIEDVTSGYIKRRLVLFALSIGVGTAVALSMVRILIPQIQLWHFLLPGYIASILLMFVVPKLFIGIAFDSGGVASGPMTATFILAFAQGVAHSAESANVLTDAFGIIAMVAMTPIITLLILGYIFKLKSVKGGLEDDAA